MYQGRARRTTVEALARRAKIKRVKKWGFRSPATGLLYMAVPIATGRY